MKRRPRDVSLWIWIVDQSVGWPDLESLCFLGFFEEREDLERNGRFRGEFGVEEREKEEWLQKRLKRWSFGFACEGERRDGWERKRNEAAWEKGKRKVCVRSLFNLFRRKTLQMFRKCYQCFGLWLESAVLKNSIFQEAVNLFKSLPTFPKTL